MFFTTAKIVLTYLTLPWTRISGSSAPEPVTPDPGPVLPALDGLGPVVVLGAVILVAYLLLKKRR